MQERIETKRLILRKLRLSDAEALFRNYVQDKEVVRYMVWKPHKNITETKDFLETCLKRWEERKEYSYVITKKDADEALGMIGLSIDGFKAGIGYCLMRREWGQGYMTEALKKIIKLVFARKEIYRFSTHCDLKNKVSARVMEKAGLKLEGILRRAFIFPNISETIPQDVYCYAKVR